MEFDPNIALLAVLTSGIGYLMVAAGVHKSMRMAPASPDVPQLRPGDPDPRLQLL